MTTTPERHLIKKYANRKLYETRTSRYITLEGIAELVRDGHERDLKTENPVPRTGFRMQATPRRPLQKALAERERFELSMGQ